MLAASLTAALTVACTQPGDNAAPAERHGRLLALSDWKTDLEPLVRAVDLDVGQSTTIQLCDGSSATVKLLELNEARDDVRNAVRRAEVRVEVNGQPATLISATYNLPVTVGDVQIDCPITGGYLTNARGNAWALRRDARFRLWPAGSPWVRPGTFGYPLKQRWFASDTQMANEPTFVDGVESPAVRTIYYHYGLDFGGSEGQVGVLASVDGLVVQAAEQRLPGSRTSIRYDKVSILDRRGWSHGYSHLVSIEPGIEPGAVVKMGQKIGTLGKEGHSGGWSHLHFDIWCDLPSGRRGSDDAYPFVWQAYMGEYSPKLIAVARPHHLIWTGQTARLDGSRSWSAVGGPLRCEWTFADGSHAQGPAVERTYARAGVYSEILKVTDGEGRVAYDFAVVQVIDREHPDRLPAGIHAVYQPTFGIGAGTPVTFKVRSFGTTHGSEVWDFGDGSPPVTTRSDGNVEALAKDGYAVTEHTFARAGDYIVTVRRSNEHGMEAIAHLHVHVGG
jgi:murein DD-endopeptidase MepM/ murein hydrolase activator NlpD